MLLTALFFSYLLFVQGKKVDDDNDNDEQQGVGRGCFFIMDLRDYSAFLLLNNLWMIHSLILGMFQNFI